MNINVVPAPSSMANIEILLLFVFGEGKFRRAYGLSIRMAINNYPQVNTCTGQSETDQADGVRYKRVRRKCFSHYSIRQWVLELG